jgi:hypothetical protein
MREALANDKRRDADAKDREIEQLRADLAKKSRIIAEVIEENLEMKKNSEARVDDTIHGCGEGAGAGAGRANGRADRLRFQRYSKSSSLRIRYTLEGLRYATSSSTICQARRR